MNVLSLKDRLLHSKLFKDSFWAVFGNGLGNGLLLLSGIIIARILGKDLYGEYGLVKTTMFYIAAFASFGLGITSTKFIAKFVNKNDGSTALIIRQCLLISLGFSSFIALMIALHAEVLSNFLGVHSLKETFVWLSILIVTKGFSTAQAGVLAGCKKFKENGKNNIMSGLVFFSMGIPLAYYCSLNGALFSLCISQVVLCFSNGFDIYKVTRYYGEYSITNKSYYKEILRFSCPVALQESSIWICNWLLVLLITKFMNVGQLGMYTAAAQWNSIILMIPALLSNVVLSHLSGSETSPNKILKLSLIANFICTIIPFLIVVVFSTQISDMYGESFSGISSIIKILTISTVFECCSYVYKSLYIANNLVWRYFFIRLSRDMIMLLSILYIVSYQNDSDALMKVSFAITISSFVFFILLFILKKKC